MDAIITIAIVSESHHSPLLLPPNRHSGFQCGRKSMILNKSLMNPLCHADAKANFYGQIVRYAIHSEESHLFPFRFVGRPVCVYIFHSDFLFIHSNVVHCQTEHKCSTYTPLHTGIVVSAAVSQDKSVARVLGEIIDLKAQANGASKNKIKKKQKEEKDE